MRPSQQFLDCIHLLGFLDFDICPLHVVISVSYIFVHLPSIIAYNNVCVLCIDVVHDLNLCPFNRASPRQMVIRDYNITTKFNDSMTIRHILSQVTMYSVPKFCDLDLSHFGHKMALLVLRLVRGPEYCDQFVCLCVCLSVCPRAYL